MSINYSRQALAQPLAIDYVTGIAHSVYIETWCFTYRRASIFGYSAAQPCICIPARAPGGESLHYSRSAQLLLSLHLLLSWYP
jgi:hypothetical protein